MTDGTRHVGAAACGSPSSTRTRASCRCWTSASSASAGSTASLASAVPVDDDRRDAPQRAGRRPRRPRPARAGTTWSGSAPSCPGLGVVVCTGQSTVAQRVRGLRLGRRRLADQALPSGGADRPRRGGRAPPPARRARAPSAARSLAGELEIRSDRFQAFVDGRSVDLTRREFELIELLAGRRGPRARARGDLPARVGLRDGARRPLGGRLRAQAAPEAREGVAGVALHPHALRRRLPLRGRAGRRGPRRAARAGHRRVAAPVTA